MTRRKRIGVVGLGMAAAPHMHSLADLAERVEPVVFSPTPERRKAFARHWSVPEADSLDALLDDAAIDALLVLTPPASHGEIVERAAKAGKHVLLEKPLEITLQRAGAMIDQAERAGITLGVVLQHRFRPVSVKLAEMLADGMLGEIVGASARLSNWRPQSYYDQPGRGTYARDGGGVLVTQAIHTLDLLISLAGLPVEAVAYAATTPVHRMEGEDMVAGAVRFANGAIGAIAATTAAYPGQPDAIELLGTLGVARIENASLFVQLHDGSKHRIEDGSVGGGAGGDPMAFSHQHHRALIEDFLAAIETGGKPKVTGREALKVHRLIDALLRSAHTGRSERV